MGPGTEIPGQEETSAVTLAPAFILVYDDFVTVRCLLVLGQCCPFFSANIELRGTLRFSSLPGC